MEKPMDELFKRLMIKKPGEKDFIDIDSFINMANILEFSS